MGAGGWRDQRRPDRLPLPDRSGCGRVHVEYYNASHVQIGTDDSGLHCAPGNGKTQWFVSESFSARPWSTSR